jgi:hypothetical protein
MTIRASLQERLRGNKVPHSEEMRYPSAEGQTAVKSGQALAGMPAFTLRWMLHSGARVQILNLYRSKYATWRLELEFGDKETYIK